MELGFMPGKANHTLEVTGAPMERHPMAFSN